MRRDDDLIRTLMLKLEAVKIPGMGVAFITPGLGDFIVEGHTREEVEYHLNQIALSGFIVTSGERTRFGIGFKCLTPAGHDFVNAVREPRVWAETKSRAAQIGGATISILRDLAVAVLKGEASKHGWPIG